MIIAIDGPAGSGKGTLAKALAKKLNLINIDTGAMYRCVALKTLRNNNEKPNFPENNKPHRAHDNRDEQPQYYPPFHTFIISHYPSSILQIIPTTSFFSSGSLSAIISVIAVSALSEIFVSPPSVK